ncbi:MAG: ABC transporter ATP-binding protein/permease [Clostridia bacterium]|nr:ABC transporter ATP-binding protein/permease [Clostridia bacterium]
MKDLLKLFQYMKRGDRLLVAVCVGLVVLQGWLELKLPDYMAAITQLVQTEGSALEAVLAAGGNMILCALLSLAAAVAAGFLVARIAAGFSMRLREATFRRVLSFTREDIGNFSTASLITRSTNDVTQIQMVVAMGLQASVRAPIMATLAIIKIAGKSWQWTAATAAAVGVILILITILFILVVPKFTRLQVLTDNLNRVTRENLTGIRVVRAYNAESYQERKFAVANDELTGTLLFTQRTMAAMAPGLGLIMSGLTLAIYWIGVYMIEAAAVPLKIGLFSDMVVFSSYAVQIIMSFVMLTVTFIILPRSFVAAHRLMEVLKTEPGLRDGTYEGSSPDQTGAAGSVASQPVKADVPALEFRNVSFRYPGAEGEILQDLSFTARRGETVAIIGSTGSGKSTLVDLVPRFFDATRGQVLVNGVDVKEYKQAALRRLIGYVSQRAVLFSGTVASNVAYGELRETEAAEAASAGSAEREAAVREAIRVAQAEDFVAQMEGGLEAAVAQGGTNVSGGQKQRLSIARAIYRDPEIYIFDDSFSALDYKTDRALRKALREKTRGATMLIVAQRIGTILDADKILVLDEGRIVGQGRHRELLANCRVYREIAESQLSEEELSIAG